MWNFYVETKISVDSSGGSTIDSDAIREKKERGELGQHTSVKTRKVVMLLLLTH